MKIAWFTPFSKKSAIGKYSQIATDELSRNCHVDLWISERDDLLPAKANIFHFDAGEDLTEKLRDYDLAVYNLGDFLPYHKDIYEVSKRVKGVVILHDFVMHHFFYGYYIEHLKRKDLYRCSLERLYGKNGVRMAEGVLSGKTGSDQFHEFPFFEQAISGAFGVIAHSHFLNAKVAESFSGPVETIYFPFRESAFSGKRRRKIPIHISEDKLLAITVGNVNPNKRVHKVVEVIGKNKELQEKFQYLVIGSDAHKPYISRIQAIIDKYGIKKSVRILGYQEEKVLNAYMERADIVINLRHPVMEGASWSLLEQLFWGKAIIVTDGGFYGEIPGNCVIKISPKKEEKDLYAALKRLADNEQLRNRMGTDARRYAKKNFCPEEYCRKFISFAETIIHHKPVFQLIDKVSSVLRYMQVDKKDRSLDKITNEIYMLSHDKTGQ